jgi:hypothetical protein
MTALDITWRVALAIWWGQTWRFVAVMSALGMVLVVLKAVVGEPGELAWPVRSIGLLIGFLAQVWAVRAALLKHSLIRATASVNSLNGPG